MNRKGSIITYLIIGIIGSVIFIFLGYFCAGALGIGQSEEIGFIDGLFTVLNSPFAGYFNDYTIDFMILGFILFESLFALFLFSHKKEEEVDADEYKPDIIDLVDIEDEQIKGKKNDLPDDGGQRQIQHGGEDRLVFKQILFGCQDGIASFRDSQRE